jgi:hypothetical protein
MKYYFKLYLLSDISIKCGKIILEVFLFKEVVYLALLLFYIHICLPASYCDDFDGVEN